MSIELKEFLIDNNLKFFEENEKLRSKETEELINRKNTLAETLKSLLKETIIFRRELKSEKEEIMKEREMLKSKQNFHREMEKKLSEVINDLYDINTAIQVFKEVKAHGFEHELLDKAFHHLSMKKEEQYRNDLKKFTPKDKQNALKILDEIKGLGFKISEDVLKKISEIAGI